jgi:hypothetical protein
MDTSLAAMEMAVARDRKNQIISLSRPFVQGGVEQRNVGPEKSRVAVAAHAGTGMTWFLQVVILLLLGSCMIQARISRLNSLEFPAE